MQTNQALEIFTHMRFIDYELGGPTFIGADSPGIVFICCELPATKIGETRFKLLRAADEPTSALMLANALLGQKWDCDSKVYARLHIEPDRQKRALKMLAIDYLSNRGK